MVGAHSVNTVPRWWVFIQVLSVQYIYKLNGSAIHGSDCMIGQVHTPYVLDIDLTYCTHTDQTPLYVPKTVYE